MCLGNCADDGAVNHLFKPLLDRSNISTLTAQTGSKNALICNTNMGPPAGTVLCPYSLISTSED